ncbi:hypothetical protein [Rathayibacter toxicus]|uniref:hypothetical protein n=1 Tax=Rathayibacter toxicus TaxID=145458 RepID=UPI0011B09D5B|nr:hypothetical protein [Rathayibacter toxicus]QOD07704.1 hypothetical protein AYW78_07410 [Rathayibacter toxicus]QWL26371.1 hypothetical protein E2R32_07285 [Rathayibacter toxicus]QWL49414.1 hypothetical protein E2R43_07250 [Rathayibacter toxicus]QWL51481.1 hypothetical protein E2R44_07295 [Rathayibacter toxicus]QWL53813.1 hypothetical protein E2R45_07255 [Rathayibacter toxicus]
MIERAIDFARPRHMRCGACDHEWNVTGEFLNRVDPAPETCPACNTDWQSEERPHFHAVANDPAQDDASVFSHYWYHSSTHDDWPNKECDPARKVMDIDAARDLAEELMSRAALEEWAQRQKTKALHVGTYEAAIENMFRRICYQNGSSEQFFLYRVRLRSDCIIEPGVHQERTDLGGDVQIAEVCQRPGANVFRYVNVHEDVSSISLAITAKAVEAVQQIAVPLPMIADDPWIVSATERLLTAASRQPKSKTESLLRRRGQESPALLEEACELVAEVERDLPYPLRNRFSIKFNESDFQEKPSVFPAKVLELARLVTNPHSALDELSKQQWRIV